MGQWLMMNEGKNAGTVPSFSLKSKSTLMIFQFHQMLHRSANVGITPGGAELPFIVTRDKCDERVTGIAVLPAHLPCGNV